MSTAPVNAFNTALALDGDSLALTDGGGTLKVDLSGLRNLAPGSGITGPGCVPQPDDLSAQYDSGPDWGAAQDSLWQSFTIHSTGDLVDVSWYEVNQHIPSGTLNIYAGEGNGGTLLLTQPLGASVPTGWVTATLATPIPVMAGAVYTMELISSTNFIWVLNGDNTYMEGRSSYDPTLDLKFRTTVTNICADGAVDLLQVDANGNVQLNQVDTIHFSDGTYLTTAGDDLGDHTATQTLEMAGNDINGADTVSAAAFVGNGALLTNVPGDDLGDHTATQNVKLNGHFLSGDGGNEGVFVDANGKVGIGISNPVSNLDVAGYARFIGNDPELEFLDTAGTDGTRRSTISTTMVSLLGSTPTSQAMQFNVSNNTGTGTTEVMTLRGNGKVGVGTSSPTETLDVNGTVRIRGGSPEAGSVLTATGTDGTATWSAPAMAYAKISGLNTYTANSGWKNATGTAALSVTTGDRLMIQAQATSYLSGGSGVDDFQYRVQITGCASATAAVLTYRPPQELADHNGPIPISYLDVWVATCTGTVNLQFQVQNTGDDSWNITNRTLVVTNGH